MNKAFSLIELLVVISIVGILLALSLFGIANSRESARDAKRKADLELIRSGLEIYRADCDSYPASITGGSSLIGNPPPSACATTNTYISLVPLDPISPSRRYIYTGLTASTYEICASLEKGGVTVSCGGSSNCGSGTVTVPCNYKVINP